MSSGRPAGASERASPGPVLAVFALLAAVTVPPYLIAGLAPPRERAFAGNFHWVDDYYVYLSFVQQAEDGALLFKNKLLLAEHDAALLNLEWWAVGRLSAALGGHPFVAFRVMALVATLAFLFACDRLLRRAGLPEACRGPGLLFVCIGGGLGGLLFELTELPVSSCLDLSLGLFPFVEILSNPHWIAARALFVWSLVALLEARDGRGFARVALLGSLLAVVRPYDFALLGALRLLGVLLSGPPAGWLRRLWPLASLLPGVAWNLWVFYASSTFSAYPEFRYTFPSWPQIAWALGPATLLALAGLRRSVPEQSEVSAHLAAWGATVLAILTLRPVNFALQFAVGVGLPLLALGALGLSRLGPRVVLLAALAYSTTAVVAVRIVLQPDPNWFVARERLGAALVLRDHCTTGELALAPPDIGLYLGGLSACRPFVSHVLAPEFPRHLAAVQDFYGHATPELRAALLDRVGVRYLVLPGDPGESPGAWLGEGTPFRQIAHLPGGSGGLSVYRRLPVAGPGERGRYTGEPRR